MSWKIRQATIDDAPALQRCMESAYAPYIAQLGGARLPPMDLDYEKEIREFPTWVATLDGSIVAGITMMFEGEHASIANVAVDPRFQGQGLGKGLLQFAEGEAKDRGYEEIRLASHIALEANLALYRHLGWSEYERDEVRVRMGKPIE